MKIKFTNQIQLLIGHNLYWFGREFMLAFFNIILWQETDDLKTLALFNIAYLITHTLAFFVFGGFVKKYDNRLIKNFGIISYALTILSIIFFKETYFTYPYLLGILLGVGNGMYWINYHTVVFDATNNSNRARYVGWENASRIASKVVTPIIGGAILAFLPEPYNQIILFTVAAILVSSALFFNNFKSVKNEQTNKIHFLETGKLILKDKYLFRGLISITLGGFARRGAFFTVLIPLYILSAVNNEFELGNILSVISLITSVSYILLGKKIKSQHFSKSLYIGTTFQILAIIIVILDPSFLSFIAYSIIQQMSLPLTEIPRKVIISNVTSQLPNYQNHRVEFITFKEFAGIVLGWTPSYLLFFFFNDLTDHTLILGLLVIMIVFLIVELMMLTSIPQRYYEEGINS